MPAFGRGRTQVRKPEYTANELRGVAVRDARKNKRIGKVHAIVFHPRKRRVVGLSVKRPDVALMMHRSDLFVALDGFDVVEGAIVASDDASATGAAACRRLGISWDECVLWQGMPLLTEDGRRCGHVGDVRFRTEDGAVVSVTVDRGATSGLLLGITELPASDILGFKVGIGDNLAGGEDDEGLRGGIIVSPEALGVGAEGGLAERAGAATAVVGDKASRAVEAAKPAAAAAAQKTGEAVNKGAFALGRQLGRTRGMFSSFKEEYQKARHDDEDQA